MSVDTETLLTLKEAANLLKCHQNTLRNWDRSGLLKALRIGKRKLRRYRHSDLLALTNGDSPHVTTAVNSLDSSVQARLAAIVQSSDDAIIGKDLNAIITSWNTGAEKIYGYRKEEVIGKPITILTPPNKRGEIGKIMHLIKQEKSIDHYETIRQKKDGSLVNVSVTISPIKNSAGTVIGAATIARDITDRIRVENHLRYLSDVSKILVSARNYSATFNKVARLAVPNIADWCVVNLFAGEHTPEVLAAAHMLKPKQVLIRKLYRVSSKSKTGSKIFSNPEVDYIAHFSPENLKYLTAIPQEQELLQTIGVNSLITVPLVAHTQRIGRILFVLAHPGKEYTSKDKAIAYEVANRISLAIENEMLLDETKKALKLRDEFISITSHELKTPITSLKLYVQLIQKQLKDSNLPVIKESVTKIDMQLDKLTKLISDLLNVSKLEHNKIEFNKKYFSANLLVAEAVEVIQPTTTHHIEIIGTIPHDVYADRYRIYQVITNLLTNAIKYSPKSHRILVRLRDKKKAASFTVVDFGIGIEKEHLNKLFNKFYRVVQENHSVFPGLGMGLYISNEIIKRHGSFIKVVSIPGKGSQFSFDLPYQKK